MPAPLLSLINQLVRPAPGTPINNLLLCQEKIRYFVLHLVLFQFHKS